MPRQRSTVEDSDSNMPDQVKSAVEYGMEQTKKLSKEILPLCDPESRREMEEKLTDRFKRLVRAQLVYEESSRIVNDVVEEIEKQESSQKNVLESCTFLQSESQKRIEKFQDNITEDMIVTNKAFVAFRRELQNIMREQETESEASEEDEEEEEEEAAASSSAAPKAKGRKKRGGKSAFELQPDEMETDEDAGGDGSSEDVEEGIIDEFMPKLDPFCKKPIVEPVRNKFCKHVYDRQTTLEWLNEHPRTKCPYQGCTNPKILQVAHFVEDAETTEQVARARARGRRRGGRK